MQESLRPRIKILGLSAETQSDDLLVKLKKQNNLPERCEIKIIRLIEKRKSNSASFSALVETDAFTFDLLLKMKKVNVGWDRCKIVEAVDVLRCFKCSSYGHKANACLNALCCPKCGEEHEVTNCLSNVERCVNCMKTKKDGSLEQTSTSHAAWSTECPIFQKRLKNMRQRIDYSM